VAGVVLRHLLHDEAGAQLGLTPRSQRAADGAEHAQRQQVDLQQAQRVEVVLVPLDDAAAFHRGVFHRHQPRELVARDDEAARVLRQVAREADQRGCVSSTHSRHSGDRGRSRSRAGARR
jgi:hypothetical protein